MKKPAGNWSRRAWCFRSLWPSQFRPWQSAGMVIPWWWWWAWWRMLCIWVQA